MRRIDMAALSRAEKFRLITGGVAPRPIALVTTLNADGSCNAAPFSAFNYVSDEPPILAIGFDAYGEESHRPGERKDSLANLERTGEFVANMVDEKLLDAAVGCATDFPSGASETAALGLATAPSSDVAAPRLAAAAIAWECVRHAVVPLSPTRTLLLGRIVSAQVRDDLIDGTAPRIDAEQWFPVGRLGGARYTRTSDRIIRPIKPYVPPSA
jgi:flavin reductase (DIM6/NTAB) family NADH-FMN oxidoreductase RutF